MTAGILELALIVSLAALFGIAARLLRQPIMLAYLATGLVIVWLGILPVGQRETLQVFADLGIMFLLFLVGLEVNYASLRLVGKTSLILGLVQVATTSTAGFFIARALGFAPLPSIYIGLALTFSSTIIIVKLLSEKRDLQSLYGKISIGMMLVQDLIAVLILVSLSGIAKGGSISWVQIATVAGEGIFLFLLMLLLGRFALPIVFDRVARSQELLFLISLAWVFVIAAGVSWLGFSIEIAGFLAGLALANSAEHFQISSRVRSLRDFFILVFFVVLGASITFSDVSALVIPIVLFSLFVLIGDPLIVLVIMGLLGYRRRTSFMTGLTVAQISEFSLILAALGFRLGHVPREVTTLITAVGIITIITSSYLITHSESIFRVLRRPLGFFEKKRMSEDDVPEEGYRRPVIVVGAHRVGESIVRAFPSERVLVVDFDPDVVSRLRARGVEALLGDATDPDIFEDAHFDEASIVISTSPDLDDNLALLSSLSRIEERPKIIIRAEEEKDAAILYEKGADYVLMPQLTAGQYLGKTIAVDPELNILPQLKKRDLELLAQNHAS